MSARPAPINHVAISMPRASLDDAGRADILAFYGEVLGWHELPDQDEPGDPLILATGAFGQFVYLLPSDEPMRTDPIDHFGVLTESLAELDGIVERAQAYAARRRPGARHRATRAHDSWSDHRLHTHERLRRIRPAAHGRDPAPRTPRAHLSHGTWA